MQGAPTVDDGLRLRIASVRQEIAAACVAAGRSPESVELVAVTKTVPADVVRAALAAGLTTFGENRVQEADAKIPQVGGGTWHLIGHLQRNKARTAVQRFACIQSVDSPRLARRLDAVREGRPVDVLAQVNLTGASTQEGAAPADLDGLCAVIDRETGLTLRGLMTIGPLGGDLAALHACFRELREARDALRARLPNQPLTELSMGMTDDFGAAIAEGSTMIRVGRAIFGSRPAAATAVPAPPSTDSPC
ncbi:MAG: YggS family pyridoxal phosphate-dependent enzyme [Chloroflexi bacterium]|nr:YggS family pyridoxal phosphate-dependent enzyme [Chloroflexota bacterium]